MQKAAVRISLFALPTLLCLVLAGCGGGGSGQASGITRGSKPAPTTSPSKIAFTLSGKIGTINEDGTGSTAISTGSSGAIYWPTWSRVVVNGKCMLAAAARHALWVMNADGTGLRKLIDTGAAYCVAPCWSRDGTEIAYLVNPSSGFRADGYLHVVKVADGTDTDLGHYAQAPAWSRSSPDRIAFSYNGVNEPNGLKVITRDPTTGQWSEPVLVGLPYGSSDTVPQQQAWSDPDGQGTQWFAMSLLDIWVTPVDPGTGLPDAKQWRKLPTCDTTWINRISWSWDATRLCYRGYHTSTLYVFDMTTNTDTILVKPTKSTTVGSDPDWSPKLQ